MRMVPTVTLQHDCVSNANYNAIEPRLRPNKSKPSRKVRHCSLSSYHIPTSLFLSNVIIFIYLSFYYLSSFSLQNSNVHIIQMYLPVSVWRPKLICPRHEFRYVFELYVCMSLCSLVHAPPENVCVRWVRGFSSIVLVSCRELSEYSGGEYSIRSPSPLSLSWHRNCPPSGHGQ